MSDGYDRLEAEWACVDPAREAAEYEENARYDRFDGWDCGEGGDPPEYDDCYEAIDKNGVAYEDYVEEDDVPF